MSVIAEKVPYVLPQDAKYLHAKFHCNRKNKLLAAKQAVKALQRNKQSNFQIYIIELV